MGEWAPQPKVCWMCGVHIGTEHRDDCPFEGVFTNDEKQEEPG